MQVIKNNMKSKDVFAADGRKLGVLGKAKVQLGLGHLIMTYIFHVVRKLNYSVLFGIDFLGAVDCNIDLQNNCISFHDDKTVLPLQTLNSTMSLLKSSEHIFLPPRTEALISIKLTNKAAERFHSKHALIEHFITAGQRGFCVAKTLVNNPNTNKLFCRVLNPFDEICKIPCNFIVATLSSVTDIDTRTVEHSSVRTPNGQTVGLAADSLQACTERSARHCNGCEYKRRLAWIVVTATALVLAALSL